MRTVKRNPFLSGVCAILGGLFLWAGAARADVTSDRAAGIIVVPKLVFDSDGDRLPDGQWESGRHRDSADQRLGHGREAPLLLRERQLALHQHLHQTCAA